jgi:hypothetical protein
MSMFWRTLVIVGLPATLCAVGCGGKVAFDFARPAPVVLAADADFLDWTGSNMTSLFDGSIVRMPKAGGTPCRSLD